MGLTEEIQFRQASTDDGERVLALKQTAIESTSETYTDEQREAWRPTREALPVFQQAMESDQFVVLIAEADEPVGYAVLNIDAARVDAVYIHPDAAGEGVGSSLLRQLENRAQMYGLSELTVVSSKNAISFYEAAGFERVETRTRTIDGVDLEFILANKSLH